MFFSRTSISLINNDTKPPATFDGRTLESRQNSFLLVWYSPKVKYDLLTSNIRGQTTFSHTILRFSVEDACFPLLLISFCFVSSNGGVISVVKNPSVLLSEAHLNTGFLLL